MLMRKEARKIISKSQKEIVELKRRGVGKLLVESIVKDLVEAKVKHNLQGYGYNNSVTTRCGKTKIWLESDKIRFNTLITVKSRKFVSAADHFRKHMVANEIADNPLFQNGKRRVICTHF